MSRIFSCAQTASAASGLALLMSHAALAGQTNVRVPTPEIHVPPPAVHVRVPEVHIKTGGNTLGAPPLQGIAPIHTFVSAGSVSVRSKTAINPIDTINKDISSSSPKVINQIKAINTDVSNSHASNAINAINRDVANRSPNPFYDTSFLPIPSSSVTNINVDLAPTGNLIPIAGLKGIQQSLQGAIDNFNDVSEMTSMRLRMTTGSRTPFEKVLAKMLKEADNTQDWITKNMK
jgi:hypothetical protein